MITLLGKVAPTANVKAWAVFLLCLVFSGAGVGLSFFVLGATITGYKLWGVGLVVSITMLGVSYGAKYANADARASFTPLDLIQYLSQGFLWPSTWPGLAQVAGIAKVEPPQQKGELLFELLRQVLGG